jgi:hypothetical protein
MKKQCEHCGGEFEPRRRGGEPQRHCTEQCRARAYSAAHKAQAATRNKAWDEANKDRKAATSKASYERTVADPERKAARMVTNAARMRARYTQPEVRETLRERNATYRKSPRGKAVILSLNAARRAREKKAMPRWTDPTFAKEERQALASMRKG